MTILLILFVLVIRKILKIETSYSVYEYEYKEEEHDEITTGFFMLKVEGNLGNLFLRCLWNQTSYH